MDAFAQVRDHSSLASSGAAATALFLTKKQVREDDHPAGSSFIFAPPAVSSPARAGELFTKLFGKASVVSSAPLAARPAALVAPTDSQVGCDMKHSKRINREGSLRPAPKS